MQADRSRASVGADLVLRDAVAGRHEMLDRAVEDGRFFDSRDGYGELLAAWVRARAAVFHEFGGAGPDASWVARAAADDRALDADLHDLDRDRRFVHRWGVAVDDRAWGMLYVLEGSRLCGPAIAHAVRDRLGPDAPVRFAGETVASPARRARWLRARNALKLHGANAETIAGAQRVFDLFLAEFGAVADLP